jgi:hypothetical protein
MADLHGRPPWQTPKPDLHCRPPWQTPKPDLHGRPPWQTSIADLHGKPPSQTSKPDLQARILCTSANLPRFRATLLYTGANLYTPKLMFSTLSHRFGELCPGYSCASAPSRKWLYHLLFPISSSASLFDFDISAFDFSHNPRRNPSRLSRVPFLSLHIVVHPIRSSLLPPRHTKIHLIISTSTSPPPQHQHQHQPNPVSSHPIQIHIHTPTHDVP